MRVGTELPSRLETEKAHIRQLAVDHGLDFYPVVFEMIDYEQMNHIAAYGGFPTRYPHWRWGMEYDRLAKSYRYGLSKIYELVINTDPVYAYLLSSNSDMDQKLVMAHVYGHADFFKNNIWFSHTNRKMLDKTANHAARIRRIMETVGQDKVEDYIDACLSLEDLIDPHSPFIRRKRNGDEEENGKQEVVRLKSEDHMDRYINPPEYIEEQEAKLRLAAEQLPSFPEEPERDVLKFLLDHGRLHPWQRDVLSIVRQEAYYFAPQGMTKIMNEGWASYWHSKLMTGHILNDAEVVDYADHHSGTVSMQPGRLNPYKIGIELFRDIEDRWNRGRFGKEYDECDSYAAKTAWDLGLNEGRDMIFSARKVHNDVTFIDTFLTEEFCRDQKMFTFAPSDNDGQEEIKSREFAAVKKQLLFMITNAGRPFIYVADANFGNRGELCLWHRHEGADLKRDYAAETLRNVSMIWGRPAHLETVLDDKPIRYSTAEGKVSVEEIAAEV